MRSWSHKRAEIECYHRSKRRRRGHYNRSHSHFLPLPMPEKIKENALPKIADDLDVVSQGSDSDSQQLAMVKQLQTPKKLWTPCPCT